MRSKTIMETIALLQHLRAGASNRQIKRELGISRKTTRAYRAWAKEQGPLEGPLPPVEELERMRKDTFGRPLPPQNVSSVEPYREVVVKLRRQGVEVAAVLNAASEIALVANSAIFSLQHPICFTVHSSSGLMTPFGGLLL